MSRTSTTIQVSSVSRATTPLAEMPYHEAIQNYISRPLLDQKRTLDEDFEIWCRPDLMEDQEHLGLSQPHLSRALARRKMVELAEHQVVAPVESCHRYTGALVAHVPSHPVIAALHHAFVDHRPVCLSPDMIWLLICQGVAHHVNANAEKLRPQLVQHAGKVDIRVRRDDFIKGSPENPWDQVIDQFSAKVREHIGPTHDLFIPQFSTTGRTERIAAEIALLDAVQSYFYYVVRTLCEIPEITLEGTADDWRAIAIRVKEFAKFDLDWWLNPLQPVLEKIVSAMEGKVDRPFWRSIYKYSSASGDEVVTGWITSFFPYLMNREGTTMQRNGWLLEEDTDWSKFASGRLSGDVHFESRPSPNSFPSGMSRAPFMWEYLDLNFNMELLGGFVGIAQDHHSLTLRPEIGWAVREVLPPQGS